MTTDIDLPFPAPGYERLFEVLKKAHDQSAYGKGLERHAMHGQPFEKQPIVTDTTAHGLAMATGQVAKKARECHRLGREAAIHELLGAIVYAAAAVIVLEDMEIPDD